MLSFLFVSLCFSPLALSASLPCLSLSLSFCLYFSTLVLSASLPVTFAVSMSLSVSFCALCSATAHPVMFWVCRCFVSFSFRFFSHLFFALCPFLDAKRFAELSRLCFFYFVSSSFVFSLLSRYHFFVSSSSFLCIISPFFSRYSLYLFFFSLALYHCYRLFGFCAQQQFEGGRRRLRRDGSDRRAARTRREGPPTRR